MKNILFAFIILFIPAFLSGQTITSTQIGGIKVKMTLSQIKQLYSTYKSKLYQPEGDGVGDWKMQEANVSTLDLYKPQSKVKAFSILLDNKKASVIACYDSSFKLKEGIGVGNTLAELKSKFPETEITIEGGFDNITQKESIVITAKLKSYPKIAIGINSTPELDKMDLDKVDKNKLPNDLKIWGMTLSQN